MARITRGVGVQLGLALGRPLLQGLNLRALRRLAAAAEARKEGSSPTVPETSSEKPKPSTPLL